MSDTPYNKAFFDQLHAGSERSARRVLPLVSELIPFRSVIDVGCGQGTWLAVVRELGVEDVRGIDGEYVEEESLQIPRQCFVKADLGRASMVDRTFDLALCLEVVEHLPTDSSDALLNLLTGFSPAILFSGSFPHQEGTKHINEQWLEHWIERFASRGYCAVDCIRPQVWSDPEVDWWYAQNTLLYIRKSELHHYPRINNYFQNPPRPLFSCIHPRFFLYKETKLLTRSPFKSILAETWRRMRCKVIGSSHPLPPASPPPPMGAQTHDLNLRLP